MGSRIQELSITTGDDPRASGAGTMRAIVQDSYGSDDVWRLERISVPEIGDNEVLVKVHAAGMDRGTWHMMAGKPYLLRIIGFGFRKPRNRVPGLDVAGTVAAVGSAVTGFTKGDEVFGISKGSFAEYAIVRENKLARKPDRLTFEQAAVVPISGGTALQGLCDAGRIEAGQKVLIIGASGGVGSFAVQLAKALGGEVTGVCSTSKLDLVRSLGADQVIDYLNEDFAGSTEHYDLILDIGGSSPLSRLRRALTPTGTVVIVGGEGGNWTGGFGRSLRAPILSLFLRQRLTMLASKERARDSERLTEFIESGALTPSLSKTYPLDQVHTAIRDLESGQVRGKIAIVI